MFEEGGGENALSAVEKPFVSKYYTNTSTPNGGLIDIFHLVAQTYSKPKICYTLKVSPFRRSTLSSYTVLLPKIKNPFVKS